MRKSAFVGLTAVVVTTICVCGLVVKTAADLWSNAYVSEIAGEVGRGFLISSSGETVLCVVSEFDGQRVWLCLGHVYIDDIIDRGRVCRSKDGTILGVETVSLCNRPAEVGEAIFRQGYDFESREVIAYWFCGQPLSGEDVENSDARIRGLM